MAKKHHHFLAVLLLATGGLIILTPSYGWKLRNFLTPAPVTGSTGDVADLSAENAALKAQLAELTAMVGQVSSTVPGTVRAMVYSRYPLNFKNEILVDAGSGMGVSAGKGVFYDGNLIGTVYQVFTDGSIVQTIFDPGFRMPVRIGKSGIDALLQGGTEPMAVSIAKNAAVQPGDVIYTAAAGLPYGLPIGEVNAVSVSANNLFEQATVNFSYDLNAAQAVLIEK
ncbi:MAG: rod shape-determining protein MreC [Patescibacteria group bacterium]|nr:rod shape-determining protein MreC [Patescibacteria group bacterium]